jgi:hypothetical protein
MAALEPYVTLNQSALGHPPLAPVIAEVRSGRPGVPCRCAWFVAVFLCFGVGVGVHLFSGVERRWRW